MGRRAGDASRSEEALAVCADAACALLPDANMDRAGAALRRRSSACSNEAASHVATSRSDPRSGSPPRAAVGTAIATSAIAFCAAFWLMQLMDLVGVLAWAAPRSQARRLRTRVQALVAALPYSAK